MRIKVENGVCTKCPYTEADMKKDYPNVSFSSPPTEREYAMCGAYIKVATGKPAHDHITQVVEEVDPMYNPAKSQWEQAWKIRAATASETEQIMLKTKAEYESQLDSFLDSTAQEWGFKDRHSLALRAGYPNKWQEMGVAFGTWMDECNDICHLMMQDVLAGEKPVPAWADVIAALPKLEWPT